MPLSRIPGPALRFGPLAFARPRLIVLHPQRRSSSRLSKELLQVASPVAEKLEATGLWTLGRPAQSSKAKRPKGDKARVNVVNQKLCDDIIKYMGPSLERHAGCDLISIYPGVGLWSRALHDVLQPRSHILMEPDTDLYKPFLQPLLDLPGTSMVPNSGIVWSELNEVLNPTHLPHQVERTTTDEPPTRNDTLLVTANLAFFPKKKFRSFTSVASLVLYQLISSIRASSLFQKYGLVRMLIWVGDDEKAGLLPRSVQRRRRMAIESELATDWITEVCGADVLDAAAGASKAGWFFRDRQIELESCRNVMDKMTERGISIPAGRETKLAKEILAMDRDKQELGAAGSSVAVMDRPYRAELVELEAEFARGGFTTTSDRYERLKRLRYRSHWDAARGNTILELLKERDAIVEMIESGAVDLEAVRAREKEWNDRVHGLNKHLRQEFVLGRDNLHIFRQEPPVLSWDRRQLEPLTVKADEFYPNIPCCLLDIQPKAMHPLMRDIGPQSNHSGDTFELVLGTLAQNSTFPMAKALEAVWPGAAEGVIPHCPSLLDRSQGGMPLGGWGQVSPRVLNERQLCELLEAWVDKWLFKPTFSQLVGRVVEDTDEEGDGEDGPHRSLSNAMF